MLLHRETALERPHWSSSGRAHSQEVRTFRNLVNSSLQAFQPHEPPGPLDASLWGEVHEGVAIRSQLVWAGQRAELFPPAEMYSDLVFMITWKFHVGTTLSVCIYKSSNHHMRHYINQFWDRLFTVEMGIVNWVQLGTEAVSFPGYCLWQY